MSEKQVYKYATGQPLPEGAVYLRTVIQTSIETMVGDWVPCWLVWHYFLVEVPDE